MISNDINLDALNNLSDEEKALALEILKQYSQEGESSILEDLKYSDFEEIPVDIDTFLDDDMYLGKGLWAVDEFTGERKCTVFPYWRETLKKLFPDNVTTAYNTLILTGAIGIGKSFVGVLAVLYLLYRMLCLKDPYGYFGMQPIDKITFSMLNITLDAAQGVAWDKAQQMIQSSEWFMTHGQLNASRSNPQWQPPKGIELIFGSNNRHIVGRALFCLDGDTKILTEDGPSALNELVNKQIRVVSVDDHGNKVFSDICTVQPTVKTDEEYQIELDDGTIIKCTPNHRLRLIDGSYKEAQLLTEEDELMDIEINNFIPITNIDEPNPCYFDYIANIINTRGQWGIPDTNYYEGHHIIPKCLGGQGTDTKSKHDNIVRLLPEEHYMAHKLLYLEHPDNYGLYAAWVGTSKHGKISAKDYAELKQYWHKFPKSIQQKIEKLGCFRHNKRKDLIRKSTQKVKTISDSKAYSNQKRLQMLGEKNNMYQKGYKISGGKNGHASIRYKYKDCVFESRKELLEYLWSMDIKITSSAIRKVIHNTGTLRVYNMYKDVFDNLSWEYKDED